MTKVRVRGIYSTALTRLFLDKGFTIVQPSLVIAERFQMAPVEEEPDVIISDREDKQGILAVGPEEHLKTVLEALRAELLDAIIRKEHFELWAIYKGRVVSYSSGLIDIGCCLAQLAEGEEVGPDTEEVLVQVVRFSGRRPVVSRFPRLRGKLTVLRPFEPGVEVSKRVSDEEARIRLEEVGRRLAPEGVGIRLRSAAQTAGEEEIKADFEVLLARWERVKAKFEKSEAPCLLEHGKSMVDVVFPLWSKKKLDELRRTVCPTLEGHHALKACGGELANAVEMAEKLLFQGMAEEQVKKLFQEVLRREMPHKGSRLAILHAKLNGDVLRLGQAEVLRAGDDLSELVLVRMIRGRGFYDGLGTRREPGDLAVSLTGLGSMRLVTSYLGADGTYKGTYVNLNTPVEVCPSYIRYVDLEVDVCLMPDGSYKVLDEEELRKAVEEGTISAELADVVMKEVESVIRDIEEGRVGPPGPDVLKALGLEEPEETG
ncbi:hypothetical protein B6U66_01915 [Candidatus Bathyarchaeota archaeon ex4484_135]|nr:MAG: hypothetical protein B6U66_01915 [Candidatus Bathyarchaeota archaeon ex4484_135]